MAVPSIAEGVQVGLNDLFLQHIPVENVAEVDVLGVGPSVEEPCRFLDLRISPLTLLAVPKGRNLPFPGRFDFTVAATGEQPWMVWAATERLFGLQTSRQDTIHSHAMPVLQGHEQG